MWRNDRDRPDDPLTRERETERLARDEYDRPRYGSAAGEVPTYPRRDPGIEDMRVHELMTRRVTSVHPATSVERAARLMEECARADRSRQRRIATAAHAVSLTLASRTRGCGASTAPLP